MAANLITSHIFQNPIKRKRKTEKKDHISIIHIQIYMKQKFLINKMVKRKMFYYNAVNTYLDE